MPSFATEVKNELARDIVRAKCCQNAELAALLRMGASVTIGANMSLGLNFITENAAVARKTLQLLKATGQVQPEVTVSRDKRLKKKNSYFLRVAPSSKVREMMEALGILGDEAEVGKNKRLLRKRCCRIAYLRGAFLGGGTVNKPEAACHLELTTDNYGFADALVHIMRNMELPAGITDRRNVYQIYMKDGEAIMDFLDMLGAHKAVQEMEVARNVKEVRSQVNRLVNCETANLQKTVEASLAQVNSIKVLQEKQGLDSLKPALKAAAEARLAHPEASLADLAEMLDVSRSCVSPRLRKLQELSKGILK